MAAQGAGTVTEGPPALQGRSHSLDPGRQRAVVPIDPRPVADPGRGRPEAKGKRRRAAKDGSPDPVPPPWVSIARGRTVPLANARRYGAQTIHGRRELLKGLQQQPWLELCMEVCTFRLPSSNALSPHQTPTASDRVLELRLSVRPEPFRWESRVQDIGPTETYQPHVISVGENSPRDLHLNAKTKLHSTMSKLQCWTPYAKQLARQEHNCNL
ncbi:uncharacterized protein [Eschrichtius robustus]|uniref:uncharacterized protein n=1 Tax=Eschrichtius robustus TaxID=9764 RepID=UPI0035BF1D64